MKHLQDNVINEKEAATYLGLAVQTLRNRRFTRQPPPYLKLGKSVRYQIQDLDEYLASCRIDTQKESS